MNSVQSTKFFDIIFLCWSGNEKDRLNYIKKIFAPHKNVYRSFSIHFGKKGMAEPGLGRTASSFSFFIPFQRIDIFNKSFHFYR